MCGFLPNTTKNGSTLRRLSFANAMYESPERSPVECAKLGGGYCHAPAQIEQEKAVGQGAHLEDDFPRIALAEITAVHAAPHHFHQQIGGWGTAGLEVPWVAAGPLARFEKHEFEEPGLLKGVLQVYVHHFREPLFKAAGDLLDGQAGSQLLET